MKIEIKKYVDSITRYAAALAVAVYSLALTQSVHAQASTSIEKKSLKILGIGNSFLKNATSMLPGIVKDFGHELILGVAAPGGRTIQNHYEAALLGEANPEDLKAKLYEYNKQKMILKEMLTAEKWDYVTIQQSSPNSFKIDTYRPYAQNLYDYIKKYTPQAEVVFHQTWAWRPDNTSSALASTATSTVKTRPGCSLTKRCCPRCFRMPATARPMSESGISVGTG